jgi:hypothetical protein
MPVEEFQDKWTAIPFQFAQKLPDLQIPISKKSAIMEVQRNNGGWNQEFAFPMEDDVGTLCG